LGSTPLHKHKEI